MLSDAILPYLEEACANTRQYVIEYQGGAAKSVKKSFAKACRIAGLSDVIPHTLRHTCGTWLALDGVPILS